MLAWRGAEPKVEQFHSCHRVLVAEPWPRSLGFEWNYFLILVPVTVEALYGRECGH